MSFQDELNRLRIAKNVSGLNGTAPMTSRDCLNILAGKTTLASCNLSSEVAANTWAGTGAYIKTALLSTERAFISGSNGVSTTTYLLPANGGTYTTYNYP